MSVNKFDRYLVDSVLQKPDACKVIVDYAMEANTMKVPLDVFDKMIRFAEAMNVIGAKSWLIDVLVALDHPKAPEALVCKNCGKAIYHSPHGDYLLHKGTTLERCGLVAELKEKV